MAQIAALAPTVTFLDIQMPGCSGLDVAAALPSPAPHIIFCTAFDQYALDAFELNVVDYLLKPVSRARLAKALDRVRRGAAEADAIRRALRGLAPATRFLARTGSTYRVVAARDVVCFVSEGGLTRLHTDDRHYSLSPALNDLETRLDPQHFFRVSRAAIVNLDAVIEVVPEAGGPGEVRLRNGTRLEVSRRRFKDLAARLGG